MIKVKEKNRISRKFKISLLGLLGAVVILGFLGAMPPTAKGKVTRAETDYATDGINTITNFDGTEYLQDANITINLHVYDDQDNTSTLKLYYSTDGNKPTLFDPFIILTTNDAWSSAGNYMNYSGVIPETALKDGDRVNFTVYNGSTKLIENKEFQIDGTPPNTFISYNPSNLALKSRGIVYVCNATTWIRLTTRDAGSGLDEAYYQIDGGAWTRYYPPPPAGIQVKFTALGWHTLNYSATDNVGNEENETMHVFVAHDWTSDHTVPSGSSEKYSNDAMFCENLYVNGKLEFENVTLIMEDDMDIIVKEGGEFYVNDTDDNPLTGVDTSNITAISDYTFTFRVEEGGKLVFRNSEMHQADWFVTYSELVTIDHNLFTNFTYYIGCSQAYPTITNNTLVGFSHGGIVCGGIGTPEETFKIYNNTINACGGGIHVSDVGEVAHRGKSMWYSGYGRNLKHTLDISINLSGVTDPTLRFWDLRKIEKGDYANISISTDGGASYTTVASYPGRQYSPWKLRWVPLYSYANKNIVLRYQYVTDNRGALGGGWYIDDIEILNLSISTIWSDDVESGNIGWSGTSNWTIWNSEYNSPTYSWTCGAGNYDNNWNEKLISPAFNFTALSSPCLTFWHKYDFETNYDGENVKISTDGGTTWKIIRPYGGYDATLYTGYGNALGGEKAFTGYNDWEFEYFDLSPYKGYKSVYIMFEFGSDDSITYPGWSLDDIQVGDLLAMTTIFADDVESGNIGWSNRGWFIPPLLPLELKKNTIKNCAGEGIRVESSANVLVDINYLANLSAEGIVVTHSGECTFTSNYIYKSEYGILIQNVPSCTIEKNNILHSTADGIHIEFCGITMIANNSIVGSTQNGTCGLYCTNLIVNSNTVKNINNYGIAAEHCTKAYFKSNTLKNINWSGIMAMHEGTTWFDNNNIKASNSTGLEVRYSGRSTFTNNTISNCQNGIYLYASGRSTFTTITNCTVYNNSGDGIGVYYSPNSTITNCKVYNNSGDGIEVGNSLTNEIHYSNIYNNMKYGVYNSPSTPPKVVNATLNWWGSPNGPGGEGLGNGDEVSAYVLYKPWLTEPYTKIVYFDTGTPANPYPSISGTHNGTITPNQTITVSKLYTYPCPGTGGHTEYVRIHGNVVDESASWKGYSGDWHNITFDSYFTLESGKTYNYTIRTGSYPQIIHKREFNTKGGKITCSEFIDVNGKNYNDWIPAIRLE